MAADFSDPHNLEGFASYRAAKAGLNMMMLEWTRGLGLKGVKVFAVAPRFNATDVGGDPEGWKKTGAQHPSVGGATVCTVIEGNRDDHAGKVVREYESPVVP